MSEHELLVPREPDGPAERFIGDCGLGIIYRAWCAAIEQGDDERVDDVLQQAVKAIRPLRFGKR